MILEVAVIVLFLFWAGTLAMFVAYIRGQRQIAAQQAQGDALRDQRIRDLAKRVDDYQNGTVRMGEALHGMRDALPTFRGHNEQGMAHAAIAFTKASRRRRIP